MRRNYKIMVARGSNINNPWKCLQKGKKNIVVDALSRKDEDVEEFLCSIYIIQPKWITKARDEWKNDEEVWSLIQKL